MRDGALLPTSLAPLDADRDVMVFLEPPGPFSEGRNLHLIVQGERLARQLGGTLSVLALGDVDVAALALSGDRCRVATLYVAHPSDGLGTAHWPEVAVCVSKILLERLRPRALFFAEGDFARETAPMLAHRLGSAALLGVRTFQVGSVSAVNRPKITYAQAIWGGQLDQEVVYPTGSIELPVLLLAPLPPAPAGAKMGGGERTFQPFVTVHVEVPGSLPASSLRRLSLTPPDHRSVDIAYAERLLGIGAGVATADLGPQIEELADLLHASLACTRPVVDDGLLPKERMVGQTGRSVAPDLYLALGISGSPHHVAGLRDAGVILAVNTDVRAPIVQFSDLSYLGRVEEIIPLLLALLREWQERGGPQ